jgi:GNAT superfamily N-acetyltransferase
MQSQDLRIRNVTAQDIDALRCISRATFDDSFHDITPDKDMREYLDASFNTKILSDELMDENSLFYFVETDNDIIAYGKINFYKPPYGIDGMVDCMEIQRIYVVKEHQRKGIGHLLMNVFFEQAKQKHLNNIWLSTGSFNNKALVFYERYGFEIIGHHEFLVGAVPFDDVILLIQMKSEK